MSFEFPNPSNNLDKKTNEAILKASLEAEKVQTPEINEMDEMLETQKEIAKETAEIGPGIISKLPDKLKKPILMAIAGATLFFSMGNFDKAEAGRNHRNDNYSDFLKSAVEDVIKDLPNDMQRQQRQRERWERDQQRKIEREYQNQERKIETKERQFDRERQRALQEYQRDVDRAKSRGEMERSRYVYDIKIDAIDEAEAREMHRGY